MSNEDNVQSMGKVIRINEAQINAPLGEMVHGMVVGALTAMLNAKADAFSCASTRQAVMRDVETPPVLARMIVRRS